MTKGNTVQFGDKIFNSQKNAKIYVKQVLTSIGFCSSVKMKDAKKRSHYYNVLLNILKRHPESTKKLANLKDIKIVPNRMNKSCFEINLIKNDNTIEDISYNSCITGKHKTQKQELAEALRYAVQNQILEFRSKNLHKCCDICKKSTTGILHIDHVIEFHKLVENFHQHNKHNIPNEFEDVNDGTNRYKITKKDEQYEKDFQAYHQTHAVLRPLCKHCNLSRPK